MNVDKIQKAIDDGKITFDESKGGSLSLTDKGLSSLVDKLSDSNIDKHLQVRYKMKVSASTCYFCNRHRNSNHKSECPFVTGEFPASTNIDVYYAKEKNIVKPNVFKDVVLFDVNDDRHRQDYALFLKNGNWNHTDLRYKTKGFKNPIVDMYNQMMNYYIEQELMDI